MAKEKTKTKSPFKDIADFDKEIKEFLNKNKSKVAEHSKRISDYFEMCCFNYIVRFYQNTGFEISVQNLIDGKYRYKCSAQGVISNFSYFKVKKTIRKIDYIYDIHHNLAVQSYHNKKIYTTPDIIIVNENKVEEDDEHYSGKKRFCFIPNSEIQTFCEVKQFNPFPELLFNFIGTVNELKNELIENFRLNPNEYTNTFHLAPSLMISGKSNEHAERIRASLQERYNINILYDLFEVGLSTFSAEKVKELKKMKTRKKKLYIVSKGKAVDIPF